MLPFIVNGLVTGAVFSLIGVGLVLTYRTSGVFNFAHGALVTASAFIFYQVHVEWGVSWPIAALVAVLIAGPGLGLAMEPLAEAVGRSSLATRVTATVGVALIIQAAIILLYGQGNPPIIPVFLGTGIVRIGGLNVQVAQLVTFLVAAIATAALTIFLRRGRLGLAMRAVVASPDLLDVSGTNPTGVRRRAWMIGATLAALSGVLLAALLPLDSIALTLLVVQGFAAAAIGWFRSLPLTFLGGLLLGLLASVTTKWFTTGVLAGVPSALPFLIFFAILVFAPRRRLTDVAPIVSAWRPLWTAPAPLQIGGSAALLVGLALVPTFAGIHLTAWTVAVASILIFLSLGLLVRTAGLVSLCHVAFAAIGAAAFSHLAVDAHLPWLIAMLGTGLIAMPIGALLAVPAIRFPGLYLALATFGFGVLLEAMFYTTSFMFGTSGFGLDEPMPHLSWLTIDTARGYYYVVLAFAAATCLLVVAVDRGRLGRLLRVMADSPTALAASGTSVNMTRVVVFAIATGIAAVGGALAAVAQGTISTTSYPPLLSLNYFVLTVIAVGGVPWYAVLASLGMFIVPSYVSGESTPFWLQLAFGLFAVLYAITPPARRGVPPVIADAIDQVFRRPSAVAAGSAVVVTNARSAHGGTPVARRVADGRQSGGGLRVRNLSVAFGGLKAVQDVSLNAPVGRVTGLIGPNGAGKTTTFNACFGLLRPSGGEVSFGDVSLASKSPATRAQLGLGRSFQRMQLCDSLTVWENVAIGMEGLLAGGNPATQMLATPRAATTVKDATADALQLCDISHLAKATVGTLSTGQRRLVELARLLAGTSKMLLLDEPSSGLDARESHHLGEVVSRAVSDRGIGVLLVEHDMDLVMRICEHIYVLDFGVLLFEGSPDDVRRSPTVQAAYLGLEVGDDEVAQSVTSPATPRGAT
jgi:ABC-type branched-subunit amino acid transport system ATPase component/branched-subunit amino acid ABC-type transport system permease component